jgi:signal peptidase I
MTESLAAGPAGTSQPDEPGSSGSPPRSSGRRWLLEWASILLVAGVAALLLRAFVIQPYFIPSGSMEPTLRVNDKVLVDKLSYDLHSVHRGDVVVFKKPADEYDPGVTDLIKRVIGLPGETISLESGQIYINGKLLDQRWLPAEGFTDPGPAITNLGCANTGPNVDYCVIPRGDYYVMGDNRGDSDDSRYFGPIPAKLIIGRAFIIIWPLGHIRTL